MGGRDCILYDGECGLCRRAVAWFRRGATAAPFEAVPYQRAASPPMTPRLRLACERAVHVLTADGRTLRAGRATLFLLERRGWGAVARLLALPPFVWLVEAAYQVVANNRDFFARFLFTRVPDPGPEPPDAS